VAEETREELLALITKAAEIAGKKITGKTLSQSKIDNVVAMLLRDHNNSIWMTIDEHTASELALGHKNYEIHSLNKELDRMRNLIQDFQKDIVNFETRTSHGLSGDTVVFLQKFCSTLLNDPADEVDDFVEW
jgi:hypothetical protein